MPEFKVCAARLERVTAEVVSGGSGEEARA